MLAGLARGLTIIAAVVLTAACGGSNGTAGGSPTPSPSPSPSPQHIASVDACSLVTAADASTATGVTLTNVAAGAGIPGACIYGDTTGNTSTGVIVFAQTYPDTTTADAVQPDQMAAAFQGEFGITNAHAVQGIGDKAFEYTSTTSGGSGSGIAIFVFKANVVLFIVAAPMTDSVKIEALARAAVGRLKPS